MTSIMRLPRNLVELLDRCLQPAEKLEPTHPAYLSFQGVVGLSAGVFAATEIIGD